MPRWVEVLGLALSVTVPAGAAAGAEPTDHHRIGVDVGVGSIVGAIGATYQYAIDPLRLEVGAGWGVSGWQLAALAKYAYGGPDCWFVVGVGPSLGYGREFDSDLVAEPRSKVIPWLNLDVPGVECRSASGFSVHTTLGVTLPAVRLDWNIADLGGTIPAWSPLPQFRIGIGQWF